MNYSNHAGNHDRVNWRLLCAMHGVFTPSTEHALAALVQLQDVAAAAARRGPQLVSHVYIFKAAAYLPSPTIAKTNFVLANHIHSGLSP